MTSETNRLISYQIKQSKSYSSKGANKIANICQKKDSYTFQHPSNIFEVKLKINEPALITNIELKVQQCDYYQLKLFYRKQQKIEPIFVLIDPSQKPKRKGKIKNHKLQPGQIIDEIVVTLKNQPQIRQSIIYFIILRGLKDQKIKSNKKITNLSERDCLDQDYRSGRKKTIADKKQVFNARTTKKTPIEDLVKQVQGKHIIQVQDDSQLRKAIQLSKKQLKKQQKIKQIQMAQEQNIYANYDTVQYDDGLKRVYEHVNAKWLQAQRKAQQQRDVAQKNSVTSVVKPKIFRNLSFVVGSEIQADIKQIITMIREAGGLVSQTPKGQTILVCTSKNDKKVISCRNKQGIKYVLPQFIYQSVQYGFSLPLQDYKVF